MMRPAMVQPTAMPAFAPVDSGLGDGDDDFVGEGVPVERTVEVKKVVLAVDLVVEGQEVKLLLVVVVRAPVELEYGGGTASDT